MSEHATALVIDDERQIRKLLRIVLEQEHYRVLEAETGKQALSDIALRRPDVVLLDLGLPDMDGLAVLKRLREWSHVPVLILSVREGAEDKVPALDAGADDYVTKPFEAAELLARLRAIQRRATSASEAPLFRAGSLEIDFNARAVTVKGREVKLTATEYALLKILAQHAGRVVTHKQLLRTVWDRMPKSSLNICASICLICAKKLNPPTLGKSFYEPKVGSVTAWYRRRSARIVENR